MCILLSVSFPLLVTPLFGCLEKRERTTRSEIMAARNSGMSQTVIAKLTAPHSSSRRPQCLATHISFWKWTESTTQFPVGACAAHRLASRCTFSLDFVRKQNHFRLGRPSPGVVRSGGAVEKKGGEEENSSAGGPDNPLGEEKAPTLAERAAHFASSQIII